LVIVLHAAQPIKCPADIAFVLDESGSIGLVNFEMMRLFVSQLVSRMDIDNGNTRVALVTFSSGTETSFDFNDYTTVASVQSAIAALNYSGGSTNTGGALAFVRTSILTSAAGDRDNVPNVVVVLTDGRSADATLTTVNIEINNN